MNFIPVQARMGHKADHLQRTKKPEDQDHPARKVMNCVSEIKLGMRHINPHLLLRQFAIFWQVLFSFCK